MDWAHWFSLPALVGVVLALAHTQPAARATHFALLLSYVYVLAPVLFSCRGCCRRRRRQRQASRAGDARGHRAGSQLEAAKAREEESQRVEHMLARRARLRLPLVVTAVALSPSWVGMRGRDGAGAGLRAWGGLGEEEVS